jgi:methylglutaconyl-CoA hydratase
MSETPTTQDLLSIERRPGQAWVWINRPEVHNALNPTLIAALTEALVRLQSMAEVRSIVLAGKGASFCAGADLEWMRRAADLDTRESLADTQCLARLYRTLYRSPKPVIARVHGAAVGGGMGLVAACDIAIATPQARFTLSEVRLGLIPAVIAPYIAEAIGPRQARRYCLTGETLSAEHALRLGLVHELAEPAELEGKIEQLGTLLARGGPAALDHAKRLLRTLGHGGPGDDGVIDECARQIARVRASDEAREGMDAFLAKRPPNWTGA